MKFFKIGDLKSKWEKGKPRFDIDTFRKNIKKNVNSRIRIHIKIGQNFTKTYSVVLGSESE